MRYVCVAVFDQQLGAYMRPFFAQTEGAAIRAFSDAMRDVSAGNELAKHPEDYDLFALAEFDDFTGKFTAPDQPVRLVTGRQALDSVKSPQVQG